MVLTNKESDLLKDMKNEEELCIEKYSRYANMAKCDELKNLLNSLAETERGHLKSINDLIAGNEPTSVDTEIKANNDLCKAYASVYQNEEDKKNDKFVLSDMLSTEKHVSSIYNTGVFEFKSPMARKLLSHIQAEEQQHGEMLYAFMNANGMY